MGSHPINLGIRFLLELSSLVVMGVWGWRQGDGWLRLLMALGVPLLAAAMWGTFAVPDDPSRSGSAPVAVPGVVRLALELAYFGFATWALRDVGLVQLSWAMGVVVALHYITSYDRILWLIAQ